ncbi:hypothetical protein [Empedobacter sp. GD03797]|uniref:hypothetical protein n=1 Tax=Empedobacter sp. GD03797 TaxID=2975382 RepID=UPI002448C2A5|nr:hypothetical protein [Empedobacter sp. GD03797]MDH1880923.1 hypothetical protein [Empedobacter sp. GD03797]
MQNTSKVQQGQSFIDKTLELTGSVESLLEMAILNNVSITDDVSIGKEILGTQILKNSIVEGLTNELIATKITSDINQVIPEDLGIGKMAIESTFIVR